MKGVKRSLSGFNKGFTLVELLVALMVTSIILAAVATFAFALGKVNDSSNDTAVKQAQLRYVTLRISELIRYSKLVYSSSEDEVVFWLDENKNEHIESKELVAIRKELLPGGNVRLCEYSHDAGTVRLIPQCRNVRFGFDKPLLPVTKRKFVSVSFELVENGVVRQYQIGTTLRCWAGHLLDENGNIL